MKYKTSELTGALLDAFVAKACGTPDFDGTLPFSSDWRFGGPIIDREKITIRCREANAMSSTGYWSAMKDADSPQPGSPFWMVGSTALIAAMKAFVFAKMGAEVDL